jgi:hypothetical protein
MKPFLSLGRPSSTGMGGLVHPVPRKVVVHMFRTSPRLIHRRCLALTASLMIGTMLTGHVALADASPAADSPGATPIPVSPVAEDQSLIEQLPGDDDVVLVAGVAAITALGLTGLALLDRRPPVTEQDASDFDAE